MGSQLIVSMRMRWCAAPLHILTMSSLLGRRMYGPSENLSTQLRVQLLPVFTRYDLAEPRTCVQEDGYRTPPFAEEEETRGNSSHAVKRGCLINSPGSTSRSQSPCILVCSFCYWQ
ncbi:hypothetical protein BKA82DRAFT_357100 [Pisolithus tinctorius]|uniref:Uncharacterized protein n=1 Tax=Pisolithus tinctorius Marx 270 TaxID=870435 RepID=A0A0C3PIQ8_PISTI|nr:hypothetical protein BKA82DRAFT_357100 [Pisolithus tinctorius]KIO08446.1 hypothetical protein M404DRAFT_357100 [Pisolithus tinctorius Marx 270]